MKEGKEGRVEIDDVDKGTVKRMLEWISMDISIFIGNMTKK